MGLVGRIIDYYYYYMIYSPGDLLITWRAIEYKKQLDDSLTPAIQNIHPDDFPFGTLK